MLACLAVLSLLLQLGSTNVCAARSLKATPGATLLQAQGRSCSTVCSNPLRFGTSFTKQPPSYGCQVELDNGSTAFGYQSGDGSTCTANLNGQVVTSNKYSCACLNAGASQGLDQPSNSNCALSCAASLDQQSGVPLTVGQSYVCMPSTEMGLTNHFGFTTASGCAYEAGNSAQSIATYSCVCSFGPGSTSPTQSSDIIRTVSPSLSIPGNTTTSTQPVGVSG